MERSALRTRAAADFAHVVDNEAARVGGAAGKQVAHVRAAVFHEDPVGEAADGCRDADGAGAGDVAHVVSLLDPEQLEVAPERGGAVVHPALVDGGHDVEQDLPHVRARVV